MGKHTNRSRPMGANPDPTIDFNKVADNLLNGMSQLKGLQAKLESQLDEGLPVRSRLIEIDGKEAKVHLLQNGSVKIEFSKPLTSQDFDILQISFQ